MKPLFLLGGLVSFSIFLLTILKFVRHYEDEELLRVSKSLLVIGMAHFIIFVISLIWGLELSEYSSRDFIAIYSIYIITQSVILFRVSRIFISKKAKTYIFVLYIILSVAILLIFKSFIVFIVLSVIMSLLFFVQLLLKGEVYEKVSFSGIIYSAISIIAVIGYCFKIIDIYLIIFSGIGIFGFVYILFSDFKKYSLSKEQQDYKKPYPLVLLSHLIFIITFVNFILIGTIVIHEFGHYGMSKVYGCEDVKIVYEEDLFHTEFLCKDFSSTFGTVMGGVCLPIIISLILFIVGGKLMREIAVLMTGFNFIAISRDILLINMSENMAILSVITGIVFSITGIFLLAKNRSAEII